MLEAFINGAIATAILFITMALIILLGRSIRASIAKIRMRSLFWRDRRRRNRNNLGVKDD
jgi:hypothetical protein